MQIQKNRQALNNVIAKMLEEGKKDEDIVRIITEQHFSLSTEKADRWEDMTRHIDLYVIKNGIKYGIDVKGIKRHSRQDTRKDDSVHWIEIQNVKGKKGWIYGEAVYIAFLTNTSILYVPTSNLRRLTEEKIKGKIITNTNPNCCYIPYQRQGREDIIFKIPTEDLRKIAKHEINLT